jgi:phosphate transport system protein
MKKFDHELGDLRQRVVAMGNLAESMVRKAIYFMASPQDGRIAEQVLRYEEQLDLMQLETDKEAIRLLTVYSPVAADLRFILSVSRITAEVERIGDHATNMCENVRLMVSKSDVSPLPEVSKMAKIVSGMVGNALHAFLQNDSRKARSTIAADDMVDALNDQIIQKLLNDEGVREVLAGPQDIAGALAQILIARSLERIADQSTNICEEVIYTVKGHDIRHKDPATADPSSS